MADNQSQADPKDPGGDAPSESTTVVAVRYGKMGYVGEFCYPSDLSSMTCGARVIITTDRGIEMGSLLAWPCSGVGNAVSPQQMRAYAEASGGGETYRLGNGRILREATETDLVEFRHIVGAESERLELCRRFADDLGLKMTIVDCEQVLGGERIIFYFLAEERVDFRQLVRRLASEFQTRIEMRQIGARDEARLLADYETCGRECCCKNFLKVLKPIGMSMAKLQKTTLDVAKVSGRCGRLKCCLRYEHDSYETLDKKLPRNGTWVSTTCGLGRVVDRQILTQLVRIRTEEGQLVAVAAEDILETGVPPPPPKAAPDGRSDNGAPPPGGRRRSLMERPRRSFSRPAPQKPPPAAAVGPDAAEGSESPAPMVDPPAMPADAPGDEAAPADREDPPCPESGPSPPGSPRRRHGKRSRGGRRNRRGERPSGSSSES